MSVPCWKVDHYLSLISFFCTVLQSNSEIYSLFTPFLHLLLFLFCTTECSGSPSPLQLPSALDSFSLSVLCVSFSWLLEINSDYLGCGCSFLIMGQIALQFRFMSCILIETPIIKDTAFASYPHRFNIPLPSGNGHPGLGYGMLTCLKVII